MEIKTIRARTESREKLGTGRKQFVKWTTEGAGEMILKYTATWGTRKLPGVCWYSVKVQEQS